MRKKTKRYKINVYTRINGEIARVSDSINKRGLTLKEAKLMLMDAQKRYPNSVLRLRRVKK